MVFWFSICLSFSWCGTHFPYFWIFPMAFKRWQIAPRVIFSVYIFAAPGCSLSVESRSSLLNWRNHISHVLITGACSPQVSTCNRWASTAFFFWWNKKSNECRKCDLLGTKLDIFTEENNYDAIILAECNCVFLKVIVHRKIWHRCQIIEMYTYL